MKLTELRPCDRCSGVLKNGHFHVVRITQAFVKPDAAKQVLGLAQQFGGNFQLAEAFAPQPEAVLIMGDENPELMTELIICDQCMYHSEGLDLMALAERRNEAIRQSKSNEPA